MSICTQVPYKLLLIFFLQDIFAALFNWKIFSGHFLLQKELWAAWIAAETISKFQTGEPNVERFYFLQIVILIIRIQEKKRTKARHKSNFLKFYKRFKTI